MLLGEPADCNHLDYVLLRLRSDMNCKSKFDAKESLLRVFLGGTRSVSELQAFLNNSYFVREIDELFGLSHQLILEAASSLKNNCIKREPLIMVFDSEVQMFPWENLPALRKQKQEVYRMPSFKSIFSAVKVNCCLKEQIGRVFPSFSSIDPLDAFYFLNPSCDLEEAQKEFEEQNLKLGTGKVPKVEELASALKDHDLFIYIGHGNGMKYIPWYEIQKVENCAATILMGCCSGSISCKGYYNPQGAVISYLLAGSPFMITNLWDVTSPDIDRFGMSMLNPMFEKRSTSSGNCTLCNSVVQEFELKNKRCNKRNGKKVLGERKLKEDRLNLNCGHRQMIGSFISKARDASGFPNIPDSKTRIKLGTGAIVLEMPSIIGISPCIPESKSITKLGTGGIMLAHLNTQQAPLTRDRYQVPETSWVLARDRLGPRGATSKAISKNIQHEYQPSIHLGDEVQSEISRGYRFSKCQEKERRPLPRIPVRDHLSDGI
ncbi:hypothetical protein GIB67_025715, partial [Kingdonia uniflora]